MHLPSGLKTKIARIESFGAELATAHAPLSLTILLEKALDCSRGDMLVHPLYVPAISSEIEVMLCWFSERPLEFSRKFALMHTTRKVRAALIEIKYKIHPHTFEPDAEDQQIGMNDIARVVIRCNEKLFIDTYRKNRVTGSLILIDESTHQTVAACTIV